MTRKLLISSLIALSLTTTAIIARAQSATGIPSLDVTQISGTWYEVARYPAKREKACVSDIILLVAAGDKPHQLSLVNSCTAKKGYTDSWDRLAKPASNANPGNGELKITSIWPLSTKYWVLAVGPAYEWALIGSPNRKSLWVYSKSPQLATATLTEIKARATAQGFPLDHLTLTPQAPAKN